MDRSPYGIFFPLNKASIRSEDDEKRERTMTTMMRMIAGLENKDCSEDPHPLTSALGHRHQLQGCRSCGSPTPVEQEERHWQIMASDTSSNLRFSNNPGLSRR
mmetsp:Transcript_31180/g.65059  ORF Transcript_31180/g.65059 Transcript_31180/m.65059 type:complete len:103 (-) Transcript_31180:463-771(-)